MNGDGPLAGLLVLDLSRVLAGPFCTMLLGDLASPIRLDDRTAPVRRPPKLDEDGDSLRREFSLPG